MTVRPIDRHLLRQPQFALRQLSQNEARNLAVRLGEGNSTLPFRFKTVW